MDALEYYRQKAAKVISEIGSLGHEPRFFTELVAIRFFAHDHEEDTDVAYEAYTRMKAYLEYGDDIVEAILDCIEDADLYVQFIIDVEKAEGSQWP